MSPRSEKHRTLGFETLEQREMLSGDPVPVVMREPAHLPTGGFTGSVALGDLNGDHHLDLTAMNSGNGTLSILDGDGTGNFGNHHTLEGSGAHMIADLNRDGVLDLLLSDNRLAHTRVLQNDGHGNFQETGILSGTPEVTSIVADDFNDDGRLDIAMTLERTGNSLGVWIQNPDGTFSDALFFTAGSYPQGLAAGDVTGDGKKDLLIAGTGSDVVTIFAGDGTGAFTDAETMEVGDSPRGITLGDADGDGDLDGASGLAYEGKTAYLRNDGTGHFTMEKIPVGNAFGQPLFTDLNRDGRPEILQPARICNLETGEVYEGYLSVLPNSGDGSFGEALRIPGVRGPYIAAAGDFTGDSLPDIVAGKMSPEGGVVVIANRSPVPSPPGETGASQPELSPLPEPAFALPLTRFDGTTMEDIGRPPVLDGETVTFSLWLTPGSVRNNQEIASMVSGPVDYLRWLFNGDGNLEVLIRRNENYILQMGVLLEPGQPTHLVFRIGREGLSLHKDGVLIHADPRGLLLRDLFPGAPLVFGGEAGQGNETKMIGIMRASLFGRSLTEEEIRLLHESTQAEEARGIFPDLPGEVRSSPGERPWERIRLPEGMLTSEEERERFLTKINTIEDLYRRGIRHPLIVDPTDALVMRLVRQRDPSLFPADLDAYLAARVSTDGKTEGQIAEDRAQQLRFLQEAESWLLQTAKEDLFERNRRIEFIIAEIYRARTLMEREIARTPLWHETHSPAQLAHMVIDAGERRAGELDAVLGNDPRILGRYGFRQYQANIIGLVARADIPGVLGGLATIEEDLESIRQWGIAMRAALFTLSVSPPVAPGESPEDRILPDWLEQFPLSLRRFLEDLTPKQQEALRAAFDHLGILIALPEGRNPLLIAKASIELASATTDLTELPPEATYGTIGIGLSKIHGELRVSWGEAFDPAYPTESFSRLDLFRFRIDTSGALVSGTLLQSNFPNGGEYRDDAAFPEGTFVAYALMSRSPVDSRTVIGVSPAYDASASEEYAIPLGHAFHIQTTTYATSETTDGVGGGDVLPEAEEIPLAQIFREAQEWYDPNVSLPGSIAARSDTFAGKLFLGLAQKLRQKNEADQAAIAEATERLTNIPAGRMIGIARTHDDDQFSGRLTALFEQAGYGHIFASPASSSTAAILDVTPDIPATTGVAYTTGTVRLRFDIAPEGKELLGINVFIAGDAIAAPIAFARNKLFVDIPIESIGMDGLVSFRLVAHFADHSMIEGMSEEVRIAWDGRSETNLRPLSENPVENGILNIVATHFPVDLSVDWKQTLGSSYHLGESVHAVDLNLLSGGNTDYGQPVRAIADGRIVGMPDAAIGSVTVEHTTNVNGQWITWRSRYLHLPIEQVGDTFFIREREEMQADGEILYEKELAEGMEFSAGEQFAVVGKDGTPVAHLHLEIEDADGNLLDLRTVLENLEVPTRAMDASGKEWEVAWNATEGCWANGEQGVLFVQDGNEWSGGESNVWVAWAEETGMRKKVVWSNAKEVGHEDGIFRWRSAEDSAQIWNPSIREFEAVTVLP